METVCFDIVGVSFVSFFLHGLVGFRQLSSQSCSRKNAALPLCKIPHPLCFFSNISFYTVFVLVNVSERFPGVRHDW